MRIVILGDFHIHDDELELTEQAMQDIKACKPDLVVPLGDFGSNQVIGTVEGLKQAYAYLKQIQAPLRPILGNHDLQKESGSGSQEKLTMEKEMLRLFSLNEASSVMEYEHWRLFLINIEPQPEHSCYQVQECFVNDEQFQWIRQELNKRPGIPALMFTHAPPIGSGLRTVPEVHVRATNAYMDHNHDPYRWFDLALEYPEIKLWFSAHYHLSHIYPDSCTIKHETTFVTTGVHGSCTRDGKRQSRVVDIDAAEARIYTLDHASRRMGREPDIRKSLRLQDQAITVSEADKPDFRLYPSLLSCTIGAKPPLPNGVVPLGKNKCLTATEDGFLWELDLACGAVIGTMHWGAVITAVTVGNEEIWWSFENKTVRTAKISPWRFYRDYPGKEPVGSVLEFKHPVAALHADRLGGIWIGSGNQLFRYKDNKLQYIDAFKTDADIVRMFGNGDGVMALTKTGRLFSAASPQSQECEIRAIGHHVLAWDERDGEKAAIIGKDNRLFIQIDRHYQSLEIELPLKEDSIDANKPGETELLLAGRDRLLLLHRKCLYDVELKESRLVQLHQDAARIVAIARDPFAAHANQFYVAVESDHPHSRPQLELRVYQSMEFERSAASSGSATSAMEISMPRLAK